MATAARWTRVSGAALALLAATGAAAIASLAILGAARAAAAAEFVVSPDGRSDGDGSRGRPWDLATALGQPASVKPGDTIWLLGGAYRGGVTSRLRGTEAAPITVRQAPGQRATIDCRATEGKGDAFLSVEGEWTRFWGFEVTCTDPKRRTEIRGSSPDDIRRGGVNCQGSHIAFIDLVVHDCSNGFGFWSGGEGGEIYGCLVYNNGWDAPDRGHGHAIYAQNRAGTKRLEANILFNQFCYGIHAYGSSRAFINGFDVIDNVSFNNGAAKGPGDLAPAILVGGGSPSERIRVVRNYTYAAGAGGTALLLGYGAKNKDAVLEGNYLVGAVSLRIWERLAATGNTFIASGPPAIEAVFTPDGKALTAADLAAANRVVAGKPTGRQVFVIPNRYEPSRAHVVVYNWDRAAEVEADLGGVLKAGRKFRVQSAQDFFGKSVLEGTYDGKPLRLPMREYRAPPPVGKEGYVPPATGPEFNVFVVLPVE